jgi:ribosome-associated heat shock protein Hsp15
VSRLPQLRLDQWLQLTVDEVAQRRAGPSATLQRSAWHTSHIESVRVDQWLHAVRIAPTRSAATAACRGGHVRINGLPAKPASPVKVGDRVVVRLHQRERVVEVATLITKRVGAAIAAECFEDHTPPAPGRDPARALFAVRDRGTGRPTKRDRRQIDRLRGRRG